MFYTYLTEEAADLSTSVNAGLLNEVLVYMYARTLGCSFHVTELGSRPFVNVAAIMNACVLPR